MTACAEIDSESLPKISCTAAFEVTGSSVGATYATVTSLPAFITVARVN